jgi:hypothetical protein
MHTHTHTLAAPTIVYLDALSFSIAMLAHLLTQLCPQTPPCASLQNGNFEGAAGKYSEAVAQLEQDFLFAEPARSESRGIKTAASLNIAMCQLKLGKYGDVIGICDVILKQVGATP